MCGSSVLRTRDQVKLISFNNKSQIGSSIHLTKRNCSYSRKNEESEWDNTLVYRMSLTKFWRRRWQFIKVKNFIGEFDPGSGRTLAACLTHASRTEKVQHKAFNHSRAAVKIFACENFYYAFQSIQHMQRWILSALCWTFLVANGWVTRRQPAL